MSILGKTKKPPFFVAIYTSPPKGYDGANFGETASMLVALAATEPGYVGFEAQNAAEGRTVAICYWDSYAAMTEWMKKADEWTPGEPSLDKLVCTTGCLWPWLLEKRRVALETAIRTAA